MNFRTKIWMLPISAGAVFIISVVASVIVAGNTSGGLKELEAVLNPYQAHVLTVDRSTEQLRLTLQTAAAEGDADRVDETAPLVANAHTALKAMKALEGKSDEAQSLLSAYDAYQTAAIGATRALLSNQNPGDLVSQMQSTQTELDKLLQGRKVQAAEAIMQAQHSASQGVQTGMWVSLATGVIVLLVLGVASAAVVRSVWSDLGDEPATLRRLVSRIAEGDLDLNLQARAGDDSSLRASVAHMTQHLRQTIGMIHQATESITTAVSEIASGNQDLSTRTESTASNLQQTASSMEELTSTVRQSAESARQANQLASGASTAAQRGEHIVSQVVTNMSEINEASSKITDIITVIDGIAFQTNILALNAAVEAARAGEQGRGFAVVAGEVRTLAQRSAQAAKEIKTLINASSAKVESGSQLVKGAGTSMNEILNSVNRVSDIIGEITAASLEQSQGIEQVNVAITQLDQMTKQNSALVEESAAAAQSLQDQAGRLAQAVSAFKLGQGESAREAGAQPGQHRAADTVIARAKAAARSPQASRPARTKTVAATQTQAQTQAAAATAAPAEVAHAAAAPGTAPALKSSASRAKAPPADDDWETF